MIKRFLAGFLLLLSAGLSAQTGTPSPYSFYGAGDVLFNGTVENRSMGEVSVLNDSIHLNFQNPASYSSLKRTTLTVAGTHTITKFSTNNSEDRGNRTNLGYLAVGIPTGKLAFAFGLLPYTSVGYQLQSTTETTLARQTGNGGVNRTFVGASYALTKKLNVGANFEYNFGQIDATAFEFISNVQYGSRERNHSDISGAGFNAGLTYQDRFNKKYDFYASLTYAPKSHLNLTNTRNLATISYSLDSGETVIDQENIAVKNTTVDLPSKLVAGIGFGKVRKWLIGAEVAFEDGAGGNRFDDIEGVHYENATRYSIGGYFIPKYDAYSGYFKRMVYRAGLRFQNTGLVIDGTPGVSPDKSIEDMAVTFGFGFPVRGTFSNINLGVELGRRGTKASGLIMENYTKVSLSFSFSDLWFQKPKFD